MHQVATAASAAVVTVAGAAVAETQKYISWEPTGGIAKVQVQYDAHLPDLSLWYGEKLRTLLAGTVLPTLHGQILYKNWHFCGSCW